MNKANTFINNDIHFNILNKKHNQFFYVITNIHYDIQVCFSSVLVWCSPKVRSVGESITNSL